MLIGSDWISFLSESAIPYHSVVRGLELLYSDILKKFLWGNISNFIHGS